MYLSPNTKLSLIQCYSPGTDYDIVRTEKNMPLTVGQKAAILCLNVRDAPMPQCPHALMPGQRPGAWRGHWPGCSPWSSRHGPRGSHYHGHRSHYSSITCIYSLMCKLRSLFSTIVSPLTIPHTVFGTEYADLFFSLGFHQAIDTSTETC